jgi:putative ABC transport system ATP-binding protein
MLDSDTSVQIRNLNFYYGEGELQKQVLYDINLDIHPGEIVIMTGPSGSGKTTLLTLIGALRSAKQGSLKVLGQEVVNSSMGELVGIRKNIGFIFQAHNLFGSLTARQNVLMALDLIKQRPGEKPTKTAADILAALGLGERVDYKPKRSLAP